MWWTLNHLAAARPADLRCEEIIIAARREEWAQVEAALPKELRAQTRLIEGGENRQQSVFNLVLAAQSEWILVHDAARPLVLPELVERVCAAALRTGAALAAMRVCDTVKRAQSGENVVSETLKREDIWLAQTPQVFRREIFLKALKGAENDDFIGTDCASLVERLGIAPVALVEGEATNFKVTFAQDLQRAEELLRNS